MSVFTEIKVPVSTLQDNANTLNDIVDGCEDIFDRIGNALDALRSSGQWVGDDIDALIESTRTNKEKYKETLDGMRNLATHMGDFAKAIADKDEEVKKKIAAV